MKKRMLSVMISQHARRWLLQKAKDKIFNTYVEELIRRGDMSSGDKSYRLHMRIGGRNKSIAMRRARKMGLTFSEYVRRVIYAEMLRDMAKAPVTAGA